PDLTRSYSLINYLATPVLFGVPCEELNSTLCAKEFPEAQKVQDNTLDTSLVSSNQHNTFSLANPLPKKYRNLGSEI
ncbi:MAG: hypothetical protein ACRC7H_03510, partial [Plesiomonas shigelloides]